MVQKENTLPTGLPLEFFTRWNNFPVMPIYEFHCAQCDHDSEILVRSSDWKGTKCPHCGSAKISKKFSTFASAGGSSTVPASKAGGGKRGGGCCGGGCSCH
jgi:putative FmdB family regulatory protein